MPTYYSMHSLKKSYNQHPYITRTPVETRAVPACASLCQPPEFPYALFITLTNSSYGLTAWNCYATHTQEFF